MRRRGLALPLGETRLVLLLVVWGREGRVRASEALFSLGTIEGAAKEGIERESEVRLCPGVWSKEIG